MNLKLNHWAPGPYALHSFQARSEVAARARMHNAAGALRSFGSTTVQPGRVRELLEGLAVACMPDSAAGPPRGAAAGGFVKL